MKYLVSKYQYNLLKEEKDEILTIPTLEIFNNDWNMLEKYLKRRGNPKFIIDDDLILTGYDIKTLGNLVAVKGNLFLSVSKIESLGELKIVEGMLKLDDCEHIRSFGKLEYVRMSVDINHSNIESLGNLEYVGGGYFDIQFTPLSRKISYDEMIARFKKKRTYFEVFM